VPFTTRPLVFLCLSAAATSRVRSRSFPVREVVAQLFLLLKTTILPALSLRSPQEDAIEASCDYKDGRQQVRCLQGEGGVLGYRLRRRWVETK
jgi:hypothetical protein